MSEFFRPKKMKPKRGRRVRLMAEIDGLKETRRRLSEEPNRNAGKLAMVEGELLTAVRQLVRMG